MPNHDGQMGKVSFPERYRLLHDCARMLIDELQQEFVVEREDNVADPFTAKVSLVGQPVRLIPQRAGAGPLTVMFTDFPGVVARLGYWHTIPLPRCGCDACAEDPEQLCEELRRAVHALTSGAFSETFIVRRIGRSRLAYKMPDESGEKMLQGDQVRDAKQLGKPGTIHWEAWPPRST